MRRGSRGRVRALPNDVSSDARALRQTAHRALAAVEENIKGLRFNVAVARIYELVNAIGSATARLPQYRPDQMDYSLGWAVREALELLVRMMAPMMPHLAEGMLGRSWP